MRRGRQGEGNGKGMGIAKNIPLFALPKDEEGYQTRAKHIQNGLTMVKKKQT